jgi:FMN phosphatase YigB (HAD superfamily)
MIKAILFDLDGTLLPMDLEVFLEEYLRRFAIAMAPAGHTPESFRQAVFAGTAAMVKNDGSRTNDKAFWEAYFNLFGAESIGDYQLLEDYYYNDFQNVRHVCGFDPRAAETVRHLKSMGYRLILATNPLFPAIATHSRVRWIGLEPEDFELITTFENSCFAKPNLKYFREILDKQGLKPEECLMVGNDVAEDMVARNLGLKVFLMTDCLINKPNADISQFPHGSFPELLAYIEELVQ